MFATVARVAERYVRSLLALFPSAVQDGRRARARRHDGQNDADRQSRIGVVVVVFATAVVEIGTRIVDAAVDEVLRVARVDDGRCRRDN